ncbi:MAG: hypothetical protein N3B13_03535 [Deltaproteobacteria bacterium]|nr:hypothetical protein [Deltaproteobacteria bacterium]
MPVVEVNPKSAKLKAGDSALFYVKFFDNGGNHIGPEKPQDITVNIKSGNGHLGKPVISGNIAIFSFSPITEKAVLEITGSGIIDPPTINVELDKEINVMPNSVYLNSTNIFASNAIKEIEYKKENFESPTGRKEIESPWYYKADFEGKLMKNEEEVAKITFADTEWRSCKVPINYSLEDPSLADFYGWVFFRKRIKIDGEFLRKYERFYLRFNGVDYFARVWFNEKFLGSHEGYFNPFQFDITKLIKEGENLILLEVKNPYDNGIKTASDENATNLAEKIWIKGILNYHDTRPGSIMMDDKIAQTIGTGGITDTVEIIGTTNIRFENVRIDTYDIKDNSAKLRLTLDIGNYSDREKDYYITTEIRSRNSPQTINFRHRITLPAGFTRFFIEKQIMNPELWWPYSHPELGSPNLYDIKITLSDTMIKEVEIEVEKAPKSKRSKKKETEKKIVSMRKYYDLYEGSFGFRETSLAKSENNAEFFINGKRIFVRGTNIIPSIYFSKINQYTIQKDISLIKKANLDAVIVLDHLLPEIFYKMMDEAGIMVFQEFTLVWEYNIANFKRECGDSSLTSNIEVIKRMVSEALIKYQNHPSIVWWSMHDEPFFTFGNFDAGETVIPEKVFQEDEKPPFMIDRSGNRILDEEIKKVVEKYNPSVPYHISGNEYTNSTNYYGWYNGTILDLFEKKIEAMPIEFGSQAVQFSSEKNIYKKYEELFWPPKNEEAYKKLTFHDCQLPLLSARIGKTTRYERYLDWAFASQLYQAFVLKSHIEFFRINKYNPTGVLFYFMFNNYWEGITWATLSDNREPTIAYQQLCEYNKSVQPIAIVKNGIYNNTQVNLPLYVSNDEHKEYNGLILSVRLKKTKNTYIIRSDPEGFEEGIKNQFMQYEHKDIALALHPTDEGKEVVKSWEFDVSLPPDSVSRISDLEISTPDISKPSHYILELELKRSNGEVISTNRYPIVIASDEYINTLPYGLSPKPEFTFEISAKLTKPTNIPVKFSLERLYSLKPGYGAILFGEDKKILKNLEPGLYRLIYTHMNTERIREFIPCSDMKIELLI